MPEPAHPRRGRPCCEDTEAQRTDDRLAWLASLLTEYRSIDFARDFAQGAADAVSAFPTAFGTATHPEGAEVIRKLIGSRSADLLELRPHRCWPRQLGRAAAWSGTVGGSTRTYVRVAGQWRYVYRVIDVFVSARRDVRAARRFLERAIGTTKVRPIEVVTGSSADLPR